MLVDERGEAAEHRFVGASLQADTAGARLDQVVPDEFVVHVGCNQKNQKLVGTAMCVCVCVCARVCVCVFQLV